MGDSWNCSYAYLPRSLGHCRTQTERQAGGRCQAIMQSFRAPPSIPAHQPLFTPPPISPSFNPPCPTSSPPLTPPSGLHFPFHFLGKSNCTVGWQLCLPTWLQASPGRDGFGPSLQARTWRHASLRYTGKAGRICGQLRKPEFRRPFTYSRWRATPGGPLSQGSCCLAQPWV